MSLLALLPGYATAQESPLPLAVGRVDTLYARGADGAAAVGATSLAELLNARVPWVMVTRPSGMTGEAVDLALRAPTSRGAPPAVYVDGIRVDEPANSLLEGRVFDPLLEIDPGLVERVELVRGAVAAGWYGSDAEGGVLLVTTRRDSVAAGFTQEAFLTGGAVGPGPRPEPIWWTCAGGDPLAECQGLPAGSVVRADALSESGLVATRPLVGLRWRGGYTGDLVSIGGALGVERRDGAYAGEGLDRRVGQIHTTVQLRRNVRVTAQGSYVRMIPRVDRNPAGDLLCHTLLWPWASSDDGPCLPDSLPYDELSQSYRRTTARGAISIRHAPWPWLEHRLTARGREREDQARSHSLFDGWLRVDDRNRYDSWSSAWEYEARAGGRPGGDGWWLGAEAGWSSERFDRSVVLLSGSGANGSETRARAYPTRSRTRAAAAVRWRDLVSLRAAVLRAAHEPPLRAAGDTAGEVAYLPSVSLEVGGRTVRAHAAWGRALAFPMLQATLMPEPQASVRYSGEVETVEVGLHGRWGERLQMAVTGTRTARMSGLALPGPGGAVQLGEEEISTDAVEASLNAQVYRSEGVRFDVGAAVLLLDSRVEAADYGIWQWYDAMIPGEEPGSFYGLPLRVDRDAGLARIGEEREALGSAVPDLEGILRPALTVGSIRVGARFHLRQGVTAFNAYEELGDYLGVSRARNDPSPITSDEIRRRGPFVSPAGDTLYYADGVAPYLEDGSFLRLQQLSVAVTLPARVRGVRLPDGELTLTGRDLWVWSDYSGPDPDVGILPRSGMVQPSHPRVWAARLSIRF